MARSKVLQTFYASKPWRSFRLNLIAERGNTCLDCGRIIARSVDIIGHHTVELTPENVHDHSISLNPDLVDLICFDCHNAEHKRFGYQSEHLVYLVYGPPLSGKTSFVREQMSRGDLVVNMDDLYEAVSLLPTYDKPENLFQNVIGIHNLLIDNIKTRHGKWHNAWVIGGYADKYKRNRMVEDLGAEIIYCDADRDECLQRLESSTELQHYKDEWQGYIDKWFEQYTE